MRIADDRSRQEAAYLAWAHAVLFGVIGLACYLSPETVFGESAWLQMPRLAALWLAAALLAMTIVLVASARAEHSHTMKTESHGSWYR